MTKLLIVDDNEQDRYLLQVLLEGNGYQVEAAANGAEALEAARREPPDLIISDILMPVMDGFTLCRAWQRDERLHPIPFAFYSATYTDARDEDLALSLGAERFIVKPIEPGQFTQEIRQLLSEHRAGKVIAPGGPQTEEKVYLREYNEALIRKLEAKLVQLEQSRQETARQRDRLRLLYEWSLSINRLLDLPHLLEELTRDLAAILQVDRCSIWLLDESGEFLHGRGYSNRPDELDLATIRLPRDEPLVARLFESGQPLMVPDVDDPAYADVVNPEYNAAFHIRAFLAVPLIHSNGPLGFLVLDDTRAPRVFDAEEIRFVQSAASQAVVAIENARLYAETDRLRTFNESIVQGVREGILLEDAQGCITFANPAAAELVGCAPEELLGHHWRDLVAPEYVPLAERESARRREGLSSRYEAHLQAAGGDSVPVLVSARPLFDEGTFSGTLVALTDIRERVQAEEERLRLSTAVEQAAEGVVVTDNQGHILYANPAFARSSGYSLSEVKGQSLRLLRSERHDDAFYQAMWQTLAEGQVWQGRLVNRKKDGSLYTADSTMTPVRGPSGEIVNYVATMRDVTRELELEEQFRQAQKMEALGRLAGGIAHDFNNLLTVIQLSSRLLEKQLRPADPLWAHVQRIRDTGQSAAALTKQLLSFSRHDVVRAERLDLNQVVGNMSDMLRRLIGEDVELVLTLGDDLWPVLMANTQVEQVLLNLAVNARDAMPQGGLLTIETGNTVLDEGYAARYVEVEPGEYVRLSVSDTGVGMSPEVKARIFEPFFTTKDVGQGTGLGLATVYGIVRQHDGHVWVYSEPGQGTTFRIYLPRAKEVPVPAPVSATAAARPARGSETLLVVEDEPDLCDLTCEILREHGYRVLAARDGHEAQRVAQAHHGPLHLLLSDLVLPHGSGTELARQLQAQRPEMKVLYVSGYADSLIAQRGLLTGGAPFLSKPFEMETLTRKVREVLDSE